MKDKSKDSEKKTLSLGKKLEVKKVVNAGLVRQSFSHGRSKTVEVEVKRRRSLAKSPKNTQKDEKTESESTENTTQTSQEGTLPSDEVLLARPTGLTQKEWESRVHAVKAAAERAKIEEDEAKLKEVEEQQREKEAAKKKEEEEKAAAAKEESSSEEEQSTDTEKANEEQTQAEIEALTTVLPSEKPGKHASKGGHNKPVHGDSEEKESQSQQKSDAHKASASRRDEPRRRAGKLTLQQALIASENEGENERVRSEAAIRRAREKERLKLAEAPLGSKKIVREVIIPEAITTEELANRMAVRVGELIKTLLGMDMVVTKNQTLDADTAELLVSEFGHTPKRVSESDVEMNIEGPEDPEESLQPRPPVVTVMGHVDHGKTSLLDALRATDVVAREAGGITQHIGAYQVELASKHKITFIDTPGHEAFTEMRARGAKITDIVILVVAADDGIKEQTIEAINHVKAAGVPMIVAINKMDKPEANPDRIRNELLNHEVVLEELGGDILSIEVSAKEKTNLDKLEAAITLQAEMLELKANPNRPAHGAVIEAKMEKGRGSVATILVNRGTIKIGDIFIAGCEWGRVRGLIDAHGKNIKEAGPSVPVAVLGMTDTPSAGDDFVVVKDETQAREISEFRQRRRKVRQAAANKPPTLEEIFAQTSSDKIQKLAVVIRGDVQGSVEALVNSFTKLATNEVKVQILHSGVGGITESDVILAKASQGIILGFNIRANPQARNMAQRDNVTLKYYSVIYDAIDDIKAALGGLLSPSLNEIFLGRAEIRQVFNVSKVGKIAGCMVTEGTVKRGSKVRLLRDDVIIHEGDLKTLKRHKDEVKEVREGTECGMAFENYQDIREGDAIECFEIEEVARTL